MSSQKLQHHKDNPSLGRVISNITMNLIDKIFTQTTRVAVLKQQR